MITATRSSQRGRILLWCSAPFIYVMFVPIAFLDLMLSIYQAVCFPIYGIEKAKRSEYLRFDRSEIPFLSTWDGINCNYCSYANGILKYAVEVAARTERFWCPIRHKVGGTFHEPDHHAQFAAFTDREKLQKILTKE